jgi:flagellar biosynthesis GTPase FlhF
MKKIFIAVPLLVLILGLTAGKMIDDKMKNILQQLQLSDNDAKDMIWSNCSYSNFYFPNPKTLKGLAAGERTSIVESVAQYVKEYSSTPEFAGKYKEFRENKKPTPPDKPKTMDEMKEEQRKSIEEGIKNMEETRSKMPADQQSVFDESIKMYKDQLKEIDNPDNPMFSKDMENMYKQMYDQQMAEYNNKVAEWQNEYPENNLKPLIKKWLEKFIDGSKDVDFSAQTATNQYNREVFVKQEYESKSSLWKLCYRAGKEATNAGRSFAQKWLSEL